MSFEKLFLSQKYTYKLCFNTIKDKINLVFERNCNVKTQKKE